jgi:WD40 repeat protein
VEGLVKMVCCVLDCGESGSHTSDFVGKWVLSGGEDGSVRVWAPKSGQCKVK